MNADISTEEKEMDKGFSNAKARANAPGKASIGGIDDAGHLLNRIACATLIERVVGFMERYN